MSTGQPRRTFLGFFCASLTSRAAAALHRHGGVVAKRETRGLRGFSVALPAECVGWSLCDDGVHRLTLPGGAVLTAAALKPLHVRHARDGLGDGQAADT